MTSEFDGIDVVAGEALRTIERERMRAEALRLDLLRLFAVLGLPLPEGDPTPAEMGHALEVAQLTVAQAQRIPVLEKLLEVNQRREREREAAARQKP